MTNPLLVRLDHALRDRPLRRDPGRGFLSRARRRADRGAGGGGGHRGQPGAPTFANTVEALELADDRLGWVLSTFYTLAGADTNEARKALQREFSPKLAAYGSRCR
jgi:peptidyl-dipeptidase Dcp